MGIALISALIGLLPTGHQFNDPVLLTVSLASFLRGFIYFNWRGFMFALFFSASMGLLSWVVLQLLARRLGKVVLQAGVDKAAKSAVFIATLPVLIQEIDAVRVLFFYGLSVWLAMVLSGMVARQFVKLSQSILSI
jgi:hypothetical protein